MCLFECLFELCLIALTISKFFKGIAFLINCNLQIAIACSSIASGNGKGLVIMADDL